MAKVRHRKACLVLLQDGYDFFFGKPTTLQVLDLELGQNGLQTVLNCGGKVTTIHIWSRHDQHIGLLLSTGRHKNVVWQT
jgi:hypothetical protein